MKDGRHILRCFLSLSGVSSGMEPNSSVEDKKKSVRAVGVERPEEQANGSMEGHIFNTRLLATFFFAGSKASKRQQSCQDIS